MEPRLPSWRKCAAYPELLRVASAGSLFLRVWPVAVGATSPSALSLSWRGSERSALLPPCGAPTSLNTVTLTRKNIFLSRGLLRLHPRTGPGRAGRNVQQPYSRNVLGRRWTQHANTAAATPQYTTIKGYMTCAPRPGQRPISMQKQPPSAERPQEVACTRARSGELLRARQVRTIAEFAPRDAP